MWTPQKVVVSPAVELIKCYKGLLLHPCPQSIYFYIMPVILWHLIPFADHIYSLVSVLLIKSHLTTNSSPSSLFKYQRNAIKIRHSTKNSVPLEKLQCKSDDVGKKSSLKCKIIMRRCKWAVNTHLPLCESAVSKFYYFNLVLIIPLVLKWPSNREVLSKWEV